MVFGLALSARFGTEHVMSRVKVIESRSVQVCGAVTSVPLWVNFVAAQPCFALSNKSIAAVELVQAVPKVEPEEHVLRVHGQSALVLPKLTEISSPVIVPSATVSQSEHDGSVQVTPERADRLTVTAAYLLMLVVQNASVVVLIPAGALQTTSRVKLICAALQLEPEIDTGVSIFFDRSTVVSFAGHD